MKSWKIILASGLLLSSLQMTPAFAQTADKADAQVVTGAARFDYGDFSARAGQRLEALHTKLALTADQEKAWQTLMEKNTSMRQGMLGHARGMRDQVEKSTLPQRLALIDEFSTSRQKERASFNKDLLAFYETLSPEQKTTMDENWMRAGSGKARGDRRGRGDGQRGDRRGQGPGQGQGQGPR